MAQRPGSVGGHVQNFLRDQCGRRGIFQRRDEHRRKAARLPIQRLRFRRRLTDALGHGGIDDAGLDEQHAHVESFHFAGQGLGEPFERPFRGVIGSHRRAGDSAGNGTDINNDPTAALTHLRNHLLDAADHTEIVRLHRGAESGKRQLFDRAADFDAGIVDQHVDRAVLSGDGGKAARDGFVGVDVQSGNEDRQFFARGDGREFRRFRGMAHPGEDFISGTGEG